MKKITVDKSEGIAEVIDRIIAASDADITLVIPKNSALAKSPSNFRLLKREADLAEKNLEIDSESEDVLELAEKHDIAIAGSKRKDEPEGPTGVSDIIAKKDEDDDRSPAPRRGKKFSTVKLTVRSSDEEEEEEEGEDDDEEEEEKPKTQHKVTAFASARAEEEKETSDSAKDRFFQPRQVPPSRRYDDEEEDNNQGGGGRKFLWFLGILVVLGVIFYASTILFGRAQVSINFTQTPWNYQASFIADQAASTTTSPGPAGGVTIIPGQVFTSQKNITQLFLATGPSTTGSSKSQGTITIYNDYGSAPQELVATTRFVTPDGKIFRLVNDTTVPGATVGAGGAITPSSVDAAIIADQGGSAYNVGPVSKLTIPGFQTNSAKYAGFYGEIKGQTTGGGSGTHPVPSAADITAAKASTTAILQQDLQSSLAETYPNNFKILDGATSISITKLTVNTSTDANGNFSVFGEASLTAIGFDGNALTQYLLGLASSQTGTGSAGTMMSFKTINLSYSNVQASFSKGQLSFTLSGQGTLEPAFSSDQFASQIAGESISQAKDAIQALPQLSDGKISVWPIWLWNMPSKTSKIQITVN